MQTVLGSTGPIGQELARSLAHHDTGGIRLVSRKPARLHDTDELVAADLMDPDATDRAVAGSDTVYFTAGLPMDSSLWERRFAAMLRYVINACGRHGARLVFFDNTYMYPGTTSPQTETTRFAPTGRKGRVRARLATMLLDAMRTGRVEALIARAPEFYGPAHTSSLTNSLVFDRIKAGERPFVPVSAHAVRSLIWTPDAGRALAMLGNAPDAFGRTWHLPIDPCRLTYAQMIEIAGEVTGRRIGYTVLPEAAIRLGGHVNAQLGETVELLPRYRGANLFDATSFAERFPAFRPTTYREGITAILR